MSPAGSWHISEMALLSASGRGYPIYLLPQAKIKREQNCEDCLPVLIKRERTEFASAEKLLYGFVNHHDCL